MDIARRRHDSPSPSPSGKRTRHDTPSPSPSRSERSSSSESTGSDRDDKKQSKQEKKRKKKEAKRKKKEMKKQKKAEKKKKKASKKSRQGDDKEDLEWATQPPKGLSTVGDHGGVVVSYGDGGTISYPAEYRGLFDLGRVELWEGAEEERAGSDSGGGGCGDSFQNGDHDGGGSGTAAGAAADAEVPVAALAQSGDAAGFFAQLLKQEQAKPIVGTVHASGKKDPNAVSGQGIMAGVRTSTIRPTGMGGGAIPHDQITGEHGEWNCLKCGRSNGRTDGTCKGCGAMRRMVRS